MLFVCVFDSLLVCCVCLFVCLLACVVARVGLV